MSIADLFNQNFLDFAASKTIQVDYVAVEDRVGILDLVQIFGFKLTRLISSPV